jgi:hypothetical protein
MIQRCTNPNTPSYHRYGQRGITIHPDWLDFDAFKKDMLPSYLSAKLSFARPQIDRIDNDGHYQPSNCRWTTASSNQQNRTRPPDGKSRFRGVYPEGKKWSAKISFHNKNMYLGAFHTQEDAALLYDIAAQLFFGPKAAINGI